jgi:glycosyltransferase involved in cell wall biosynthesis
MLWPKGRLLTEDAALSLFARAMNVTNSTGIREGKVDGVLFCLDAGMTQVHGRHSIIIPSYRDVDFVWPTVKSALSQDARDFEVIVVNDNPANQQFSSQLRSIAMSWEKDSGAEGMVDRLVVIDHRQNRHAAAARNTGLFWSSGELISFLDDDDYYEPSRLSGIESGFDGAGEDVGACYCGYSGNWNGERNMERFPEGDLGEHVLALRYAKHYMCTNTITFRRTSLQRLGGFNECYARHQDIELMARYFAQYNISSVPEFLVKNRPNPMPETFVADIPGLCRLKHQFLSDMRVEIANRGMAFVQEVIDAHTKDIAKRNRQMAASMTETIRTFLSSALRESQ